MSKGLDWLLELGAGLDAIEALNCFVEGRKVLEPYVPTYEKALILADDYKRRGEVDVRVHGSDSAGYQVDSLPDDQRPRALW